MPIHPYFSARQALLRALAEHQLTTLIADSLQGGEALTKILIKGGRPLSDLTDEALDEQIRAARLADSNPELLISLNAVREARPVVIEYVFVRYDRADVERVARLRLRVLEGVDVEADFERFKKALTLWAATSVSGATAWGSSAADFNVGDLLMENLENPELHHTLRTFGLQVLAVDGIEADDVRSYDHVLMDEELLARWTDEDQGKLEAQLALRGLRMEPSLAALDGEGHAICDLVTGELIEGVHEIEAEAIALAEQWSLIEGVSQ